MKIFRYIVSSALILNFSVILWATALCPCSQAVHDGAQCMHRKISHSKMTHSGADSAVMAHKMDAHQVFNIVDSEPAQLRNKSCCCQTFDVKKESPVKITPVPLTKTKSTKISLKSGDHFVYDHGLFVPEKFTPSNIKTIDSNPVTQPIYLLNSAYLI